MANSEKSRLEQRQRQNNRVRLLADPIGMHIAVQNSGVTVLADPIRLHIAVQNCEVYLFVEHFQKPINKPKGIPQKTLT
ncbi:hypothetical protein KSP39_PZI006028 [Platanthera zijinensis]|uniref:Uncharacterized protein n=1 Tax=Platanthera zijinensis TaxID=2320716 RepID=A0AAP0GBG8_9ASPA